MIARFLLGRAGAGKTQRCLQEIRQGLVTAPDGPPLLLLVPEQATYQMDRALLGGLPGGTSTRALVVSFRRLTFRLLSEVGGLDKRIIQDLGRQMLVRALLGRRAKDLKLYKVRSIKPGLVAHLSKTLHELRQYCVEPAHLQQWLDALIAGGKAGSILALKLHDLHLVYEDFLSRCGKDVLDTDDLPLLLLQAIQRSDWLPGAHIWVDSFSDFTRQESQVLEALVGRAAQATFSLTLDPADLPLSEGAIDPDRLFAKAEETYSKLRNMLSGKTQTEIIAFPEKGSSPRFRNPELVQLEVGLFAKAKPYADGRPQAIRLVEAGSRRAEVDACAHEILHLVREHNYRFRDIAVIVRDLQSYHDLVEASFDDYRIPFFIDQRRSMAHHPLVELIRCTVRAVAEGWRYEHVLPYLRTGLAPVDYEVVDVLDNFAVEHGIEGEAWYGADDWSFRRPTEPGEKAEEAEEDKGSKWLNGQRRKAVEALHLFHEKVRSGRDQQGKVVVREMAQGLFEILEMLKADLTLERWRREAEEAKHLDLAGEHVQVWDGVMELLDELVAALDNEKFTLAEFAEIVDSGLASLTLGLIPPAVDEVLVGSIDRSRQPEIKAVFLLGVVEGLFPLVADEDPILNDADRADSFVRNMELGPTSEQRFFQESYLGYIAFTRASERLWVSYPIADDRGRQVNPSPFIARLQFCFPELATERIGSGHGPRSIEDIVTVGDLAGSLAHRLRQPPEPVELTRWLSLYNRVLELPRAKDALAAALPALGYYNKAQLTPASAKSLFGDTLAGTVSRLESFAACPFQHFAKYGLRLKPRQEFRLEAMDLGTLYHGVLKYFFDETREKPWAGLPLAEAEQLVDQGVNQEAAKLRNEILLTSARNRYIGEQVRRSMKLFVRALLAQAKFSEFATVAAELSFGEEGDPVPALEFALDQGRRLTLHGRIDRIDVAEGQGHSLVRTVDYKSGWQQLPLDEVYYGLSLQLLVYLLAVTEGGAGHLELQQPMAAAAFYSRLLRSMATASAVADAVGPDSPEFLRAYKLRGVFRSDLIPTLDTTPDLVEWSNFYALYVKKDGTPGNLGKSDVVDPLILTTLLELVQSHLVRLGNEVLDGHVEVAPVQHRGQTACNRCDFRTVCRLESPFNKARVFETLKKEQVLALLSPAPGAGPAGPPPADLPPPAPTRKTTRSPRNKK